MRRENLVVSLILVHFAQYHTTLLTTFGCFGACVGTHPRERRFGVGLVQDLRALMAGLTGVLRQGNRIGLTIVKALYQVYHLA